MKELVIDAFVDTLKLFPYLFLTFLILEFLEHKLSKRNEKVLIKNKKYGPLIGGLLGALPQCGFSSMAANLFSNKIITMGTLIAVFLSTSDEMLAIMISHHTNVLLLLKIVGFKVNVGIIIGFIVDLFIKEKSNKTITNINKMCEEEHCDCENDGIFMSSLKHSLKIALFILIINVSINFAALCSSLNVTWIVSLNSLSKYVKSCEKSTSS